MKYEALQKISYGLYVITSGKKGDCNAQIANTVFQVTSNPVRIVVCINKQNFTHEFISQSRIFTVSILSKSTPLKFIGRFGFKCGRDVDKFKGIKYMVGKTGAPLILDNAIAYLEAKVVNEVDADTHTIFIGKVVATEILSEEEPLTYAYYHEKKRGVTPKAAPTYIGEKEGGDKMTKNMSHQTSQPNRNNRIRLQHSPSNNSFPKYHVNY